MFEIADRSSPNTLERTSQIEGLKSSIFEQSGTQMNIGSRSTSKIIVRNDLARINAEQIKTFEADTTPLITKTKRRKLKLKNRSRLRNKHNLVNLI